MDELSVITTVECNLLWDRYFDQFNTIMYELE